MHKRVNLKLTAVESQTKIMKSLIRTVVAHISIYKFTSNTSYPAEVMSVECVER